MSDRALSWSHCCVEEAYQLRIAELQAKYRLVPGKGPVFYACDGDPRNEVIATFFQTNPPTLIAERGDQVSLMYLQPAASGSKYQGGTNPSGSTKERRPSPGATVTRKCGARSSGDLGRCV